MPKVNITDKELPSLRGDASKEVSYADHKLPGFMLRVTVSGARTFVLRYSINGKQRRLRLGSPDGGTTKIKAIRAREKAEDALGQLSRGIDPQQAKQEQAGAWTCSTLIDKYLAELERRLKTGNLARNTYLQHTSLIERVIKPGLTGKLVADVDHALIETIVRGIKPEKYSGATQQNRCLAVLAALFKLALAHKQIAHLPTDGIRRNIEKPVENLLTDEELEAIGNALTELEQEGRTSVPHLEALRLIFLTGGRSKEIASLKWSGVDLEKGEIRPHEFKGSTKRATKLLMISPQAVDLLKRMKHLQQCEWVFPARSKDGKRWTHVHLWSVWCKVKVRAGITRTLRLHDARHHFASKLMNQNVPLPVVSKLLGHTDSRSTMRYLHATREREKEAAAEVGEIIGAALGS